MASDLYNKMGPAQQQTQSQQSPKEAALNLARQYGYQITPEQENDPDAIMRMVLQSGSVFQNRLPLAQNIVRQFMSRR